MLSLLVLSACARGCAITCSEPEFRMVSGSGWDVSVVGTVEAPGGQVRWTGLWAPPPAAAFEHPPPGQFVTSRQGIRLLAIPINLGTPSTLRIAYTVSTTTRRLEPLAQGQVSIVSAPQPSTTDLGTPAYCDYESHDFQSWIQSCGLTRRKDEDGIAFAKRILLKLREARRYDASSNDKVGLDQVVNAKALACDGLSNLYVGVLRSAGIPSHVVCGMLFDPSKGGTQNHSMAEFFEHGIGWIPVEVAGAVADNKGEVDLYFGVDDGTFIAHHTGLSVTVPQEQGRDLELRSAAYLQFSGWSDSGMSAPAPSQHFSVKARKHATTCARP